MKNFFLKWLIFLCTKKKNKRPIQRILCFSTTGLGDTLFATAPLKALQLAYPHAEIDLVTTLMGRDIFEKADVKISRIYIFQKPYLTSFFTLLFPLRKNRYDTVLFFHISQRLAATLGLCLNAEQTIGHKGRMKGLESALTTCIELGSSHEINKRYALLAPLNVRPIPSAYSFHVKERDAGLNLPHPFIVLHPGSQDLYKMWPPEFFIDLCHRLNKQEIHVVLTGSPKEKDLCLSIQQKAPFVHNLCGKTKKIATLAALYQQSLAVVAADTGPMHLAAAAQAKTIALFCPTQPQESGPQGENIFILQRKRSCTPCLKKKCLSAFCMRQITPDEVEKALAAIGALCPA